MAWFTSWWEALSLLQQCFAVVAIPATLILLIQTMMLLIGIGGHDADADHDMGAPDHDFHGGGDMHDGDFHDGDLHDGHDFHDGHDVHDGAQHAAGLRLFTLRGIVALFAVGGWLGVAMCDLGLPNSLSILIAAVGGLIALIVAALAIKYALRLQESGNLSPKNAVAHTATVYIPIPANRTGSGKVTMNLQERFVELDAITDCDTPIPTGTMVQVVRVTDKNELIVRTLN